MLDKVSQAQQGKWHKFCVIKRMKIFICKDMKGGDKWKGQGDKRMMEGECE
jgi:hypothetical protein